MGFIPFIMGFMPPIMGFMPPIMGFIPNCCWGCCAFRVCSTTFLTISSKSRGLLCAHICIIGLLWSICIPICWAIC